MNTVRARQGICGRFAAAMVLSVALGASHAVSAVDLQAPGVPYPLTTQTIRPGYMAKAVPLAKSAAQHAFALIGTDRLSATWLRTNIEYLREHRVIVLVIAAPDARYLAAIRHEARGLTVVPTPGGDSVAASVGAQVYPVLIDPVAGVIRQ